MKQRPNVWAELTLTPVTNGVIEWLAAGHAVWTKIHAMQPFPFLCDSD
jgi:hypothetical protein